MRTHIPLSAGESELTSYGCRAMLEEQAIQILQFDCTMMGGFTEGRKLAALCELNHVQVAPHHDCFIHAHIVAASPAGCIVESFTDPERDPLQAELFEDPPKIANGWMTLNEAPGLGLTLVRSGRAQVRRAHHVAMKAGCFGETDPASAGLVCSRRNALRTRRVVRYPCCRRDAQVNGS